MAVRGGIRAAGAGCGGLVDLVPRHGGVVFEVDVHPGFNSVRPVETIAIPYVQAHLDLL
ncbi:MULTISPECIES: hypothetical protein [Streptomyces]|uniref:hypothetical protein n=1 Tax=Streptomyces TaxID=1883 RepID=UPI00142EE7C3|nr:MULTISPECIES: hypothetical protein [Streptomyces]